MNRQFRRYPFYILQTMTEKLQAIIEQLYVVFSKYPGRSDMPGSPLYDDLPKWNAALFSKPLRRLSDADLSRFAGKMITTWGEEEDLKHFLPRMLELTANLQTPYEVWILFERLQMANYTNWPREEYDILQEYMISLWDDFLTDESEKAQWEFMSYFPPLAHFYADFNDIINVWDNNHSRGALQHLVNFVFDENYNLFTKGFIEGFHKKKEHVPELKSWLLSDKVINRLEQSYFSPENEAFAERISWVEKILRNEASIKLNT